MTRRIAALVRHGDYHQLAETPSAHQPFGLNARGHEQAKRGAELMKRQLAENGWVLDAQVVSSTLLRAWQTAELFIDTLSTTSSEPIQHRSESALCERCVGSAANLTSDQIYRVVESDPRLETPPADWKSNSHYRLPLEGAESLMEAGERVAGCLSRELEALKESEQPRVRLFVGHGAAFRHAAHRLGVLPFERIAELSMYHAHPVYLELCADGQWRHVGGNWKERKREGFTD